MDGEAQSAALHISKMDAPLEHAQDEAIPLVEWALSPTGHCWPKVEYVSVIASIIWMVSALWSETLWCNLTLLQLEQTNGLSGRRGTGPPTEPGFSQGFFSIMSPMEFWLLAAVASGLLTFTFMHLADAFIQSDLQCIQAILWFVLSVYVFPGNRTHKLCAANAML